MSTVRMEDEVLLRVPRAELEVPAFGGGYDTAQLVRSAGRAVVVLLAVLVPAAALRPMSAAELLSTLPVAATWIVVLRAAFAGTPSCGNAARTCASTATGSPARADTRRYGSISK